ncbi:Hypothetical protein NTJ_11641 [Nesidiocoris tenuis]|uniref:SANTA domain-containing protein n=1 Tax=Nesidiocoris tenuis TaxID=355587 RepID=A0ABN7B362_9HEMI|nr:Hypothetical protein NTJ_11641 [Nesidiocoris tenuis]
MAARADEEALELIRVLTQIRTIASPEDFGFLCSRLRREMEGYLQARGMMTSLSPPPISGTQAVVPIRNTRPPGNRSKRTSLIEWRVGLEGEDLLLEGTARDGRQIMAGRVVKYNTPEISTTTGVFTVVNGATFTTCVPDIVIKRCAKSFPYQWKAMVKAWRKVYDDSTVLELGTSSSGHWFPSGSKRDE